MRRRAFMLAPTLAACLTAADSADGGSDGSTPTPTPTPRPQKLVDDCHTGIVGGRCDRKGGGCELGLTCAPSGVGLNYVCVRACETDADCPYLGSCVSEGEDGGSARRCMRTCSSDEACSCASSSCAKDGYCR
jgi:hypothetical protein